MNSSPTVRPAEAADLTAIGRLGAMLVAEHHEFDSRRFIAPVPDIAQRYGEFLIAQVPRPDRLVVVAERDGRVVGYAYAAMEGKDFMALRGPAGVVYDLVVDPDHRRAGVGTSLLEAALTGLAELGAPRALLFTAEKNEAGQAMFAHAGFRRTMIEMTRELSGD